jgi:hypothetical protein
MEEWFENLQRTIEKYGIQSEDIYTFDQTGFQIGVGKDQWIVTREPRQKIVSENHTNHTNREYVTVVEAISTDGFTVPPLIIFAAKQVQYRWFEDLKDDERIAVTETGYIDDLLAYRWIQMFEKSTRSRTKGSWRLLICDGFGPHLNYEFVKFCEASFIQPFFLNAHTSHLVQPLDVGVFNVYTHHHSEAIEAATATGCTKFQKVDFFGAIASIRAKTFTLRTIKLGYRLSGIWPFNPTIVCDKMVEYTPERTDMPLSPNKSESSTSSLSTNFGTPTTIREIQKLEKELLRSGEDMHDYTIAIQKLAKSAQLALYQLKEVRREMEATKATTLRRDERHNLSRSGLRTWGIVSAQNLQKMKRGKEKLTELEAIDKVRPKWRKVMEELKRESRRSGRRLRR